MTTEPSRAGKPRCRWCGDTLHPFVNGWGHDKDNFATCLDETAIQGRVVMGEPITTDPARD